MEWSRTGSKYDGRTKDRRMHGSGTYTFPTGSTYDGEFRDGEFHGDGTLTFTHGGKFVGQWRKGLAVEGRYVFADGLAMDDVRDPYCLPGRDRRFQTERLFGLKPAGRSQLTNLDPPVKIPAGFYDEGKGFFDPSSGHVIDYEEMKFIQTKGPDAQKWIKNTCRKGWDEAVGFHRKDYSMPHTSDRSTWPKEKTGHVELPSEYRRGTAIVDRRAEVTPSSTRDSETQMPRAFAVVTDKSGRRHRAASLCSASTSRSSIYDGFGAVRRAPSWLEAEEREEEEEEEVKKGEDERGGRAEGENKNAAGEEKTKEATTAAAADAERYPPRASWLSRD